MQNSVEMSKTLYAPSCSVIADTSYLSKSIWKELEWTTDALESKNTDAREKTEVIR